MNTTGKETVKTAIIDNVKYSHDWSFSTLAAELYWWVDFFNIDLFQRPTGAGTDHQLIKGQDHHARALQERA